MTKIINRQSFNIGNLRLSGRCFLAPLAGVSDWPFRALAREQGAALTYTEMISSEGLIREGKLTRKMIERPPDEKPFAVQIFGSDPGRLALAALQAEKSGADIVDINMGCPVKKVCRTGAGAALMKKPDLINDIMKAVLDKVTIPVQVKLRSGWDSNSINVLDIAHAAENAGISAVTVHGRTKMQGYTGSADWNIIAEVRRSLSRMKVIGNGDISSASDALEKFRESGVDAVMIGRGSFGYPWIFREAAALFSGKSPPDPPDYNEWRKTIIKHLDKLCEYRKDNLLVAARLMRKHLIWYTRGRRGAPAFRGDLSKINTIDDIFIYLDRHFSEETWQMVPFLPEKNPSQDHGEAEKGIS